MNSEKLMLEKVKLERKKFKNDKQNSCIICYNTSNPVSEFECGHKVCGGCFHEKISERLQKSSNIIAKCCFSGCYHVLKNEEFEPLKDYFQIGKSQEKKICGGCDKDNTEVTLISLHDSHAICKECLKTYVEEITKGIVYAYEDSIGHIKKYKCPFPVCTKEFDYELVSSLYTFEENQELLSIARDEFGLIS